MHLFLAFWHVFIHPKDVSEPQLMLWQTWVALVWPILPKFSFLPGGLRALCQLAIPLPNTGHLAPVLSCHVVSAPISCHSPPLAVSRVLGFSN